jgi:hypothetical protein
MARPGSVDADAVVDRRDGDRDRDDVSPRPHRVGTGTGDGGSHKNGVVRYMVIEHFTSGPGPVYERAAAHGRALPEGLHYVDSWVVADEALDRCFQLMETDDPRLIDEWIEHWRDLATFEYHPVIGSAEAAARVAVRWDPTTGNST